MKRVRIKQLRAVASLKKEGYLRACREKGVPSKDGQWLTFSDADHAAIAMAYATPECPPLTRLRPKLPSLGQAVDRKPTAGCRPCLAKAIQAQNAPAKIQP